MKRIFLLSLFAVLISSTTLPQSAFADSGHARIVRLSQIQGDVRFARNFHGDPLTDTNAVWESAQLNLPIREGNVLSTGNGRAVVEFENGAMAFLGANSVLEFFDLSLNDGSRVTRLILRQGSASFFDRSENGDYFSVTGGDFSVEVTGRATFRLEDFDDGSTVNVQAGRVNVIQNEKSTPLEKGQSLSVQAKDPSHQVVASAAAADDFDHWVSNLIKQEQTVMAQPSASSNYASNIYGYSDLYTYGSWNNVNGAMCWSPFGVGLGWSPFQYGSWYFDGGLGGWGFIGAAPWGWLPYHYGGWIFSPVFGWVWNPGNLFYYNQLRQPYRPVTAVFVRTGNTVGVVPMNPGDKPGHTPLNIAQGVYPLENGALGRPVPVAAGEKLSVLKNSANLGLTTAKPVLVASPTRVNRTISATNLNQHETVSARNSSIVYDSTEHRFVNPSQGRVAETARVSATNDLRAATRENGSALPAQAIRATPAEPIASRSPVPARPPATPAPAHTSSSSSSGGGSWWGNPSSSSSAASGSSRSSGSSSSHPSGGGGGGRPH
jgi:FecR protein